MSVREARFRKPVQKQSAGTRCRETAQRSPNVPGVVRAEAVRMKTAARREAAGTVSGADPEDGRRAGCGEKRRAASCPMRTGPGQTGQGQTAGNRPDRRAILPRCSGAISPRPSLLAASLCAAASPPRKRRSARLCEKVFVLGHDFFAATGTSFSLPLIFYFKVSMLNE